MHDAVIAYSRKMNQDSMIDPRYWETLKFDTKPWYGWEYYLASEIEVPTCLTPKAACSGVMVSYGTCSTKLNINFQFFKI